jgi:phosphatidylglycerophosphatase A
MTYYPAAKQVFRDPRLFLAFGLGSGLSRVMPGTMGTLAAVPLYLCLAYTPTWSYLLILVVATLVGIHLCGYAARVLGVHDHGGIVWDEFVGFWITMIAIPLTWQWVLAGFVLFRVFDMLKPWPISWLDKNVHGGLGIMIDDIAAGVCSWACLQLAIWWL